MEPLRGCYPPTEKPVFFGHYSMPPETSLQSTTAMCVDHSVAQNGVLCSYRWSGEKQLQIENVSVVGH